MENETKQPKTVVIYGGAFDPPTRAHAKIIETLCGLNHVDEVIVLVMDATGEKTCEATYQERLEMAKIAFSDRGCGNYVLKPRFVCQRYRMVHQLYDMELNNTIAPNDNIYIAVGADEMQAILDGMWEHTAVLANRISKFIVFRRNSNYSLHNSLFKLSDFNIEFHADNGAERESSTRLRKILNLDPFATEREVMPCVGKYMQEHHVYGQWSRADYAKRMSEFTKDYKPDSYPKPSVTATVMVYHKDKFALVKRKRDPYFGTWALPGGFAEPKDSPEEAAIREVKEETGIELKPEWLTQLGVVKPLDPRASHPNFWMYDVAFLARVPDSVELKPKAGDDAGQFLWVDDQLVLEQADADPHQPWEPTSTWTTRIAFHHIDIINKGKKLIQEKEL